MTGLASCQDQKTKSLMVLSCFFSLIFCFTAGQQPPVQLFRKHRQTLPQTLQLKGQRSLQPPPRLLFQQHHPSVQNMEVPNRPRALTKVWLHRKVVEAVICSCTNVFYCFYCVAPIYDPSGKTGKRRKLPYTWCPEEGEDGEIKVPMDPSSDDPRQYYYDPVEDLYYYYDPYYSRGKKKKSEGKGTKHAYPDPYWWRWSITFAWNVFMDVLTSSVGSICKLKQGDTYSMHKSFWPKTPHFCSIIWCSACKESMGEKEIE